MKKTDVERILSEALGANKSMYVWTGGGCCHFVSNVFYPTDARPFVENDSLAFFDRALFVTAYIDLCSITDIEIQNI